MALFTAGVVFLVLAVLDFVIAYGLWSGKRWAWVLSLVFSVLGVMSSIFSLFLRPRIGEFLALVIDLAIVCYLIQPRVQAYFGRGAVAVETTTPGAVITGGAPTDDKVKLSDPSNLR
jgi:uncharacterized membrane protein (DUF2068 family)